MVIRGATAGIVLCDVTGGKEKGSNPEEHSTEKSNAAPELLFGFTCWTSVVDITTQLPFLKKGFFIASLFGMGV